MSDTISFTLEFTPEEYGALMACLEYGAEAVQSIPERLLLANLEDKMRNAQRQGFAQMTISSGMQFTRSSQSTEATVKGILQRSY